MLNGNSQEPQIAECNEVVVSKLARSDYPNLWYLSRSLRKIVIYSLMLCFRPTLVDDLVQIIDSNLRERYTSGKEDLINYLKIRRSLKLLNGILKEFSAIKLPNGMKTMAQVRQWFYNIFKPIYSQTTSDCGAIASTAL